MIQKSSKIFGKMERNSLSITIGGTKSFYPVFLRSKRPIQKDLAKILSLAKKRGVHRIGSAVIKKDLDGFTYFSINIICLEDPSNGVKLWLKKVKFWNAKSCLGVPIFF